jgi:hypothetical protein
MTTRTTTMRARFMRMAGALAVLAAAPVAARTISITIGQRAELRDGQLHVGVTVGNSGDEAAKSVSAIVRFHDKEMRAKAHDELRPNATVEDELTVPAGELGEGRWPYQIAVDYTDANAYPFQALLVTPLVVGNPAPAKISIPEISAAPIAESGSLKIRFKNLAGAERDTTYRVIAPEGIEATAPTGSLHLAAYGEGTTAVSIVNHTALAGSRLPVFVAVEYDDGAVHQGLVAQGIVEIVAAQSFWEQNRTLLLVVAGVLVALWLGLVVRRATARPR